MKLAPINLTAAAEDFIRRSLEAAHRDQEPALLWTPHELGENGLFCYEGPAVWIGWYPKGTRPAESFFELCGRSISISRETLRHIEGRTIDFLRFPTGFIDGPKTYSVLKVS